MDGRASLFRNREVNRTIAGTSGKDEVKRLRIKCTVTGSVPVRLT
jgi:hypothetical protein